MPNLGNIGKTPLYRGVDWLRVGYFVEALNIEEYNLFIDNLRDFLNLPYTEQYYEIPPTNIGNLATEPFKVRVKTTANIYPYVIMLVWEDFNISIRLGHSLTPKQIENLYKGFSPTPNVLIELTGKALRPTTLFQTKLFLKAFFQLIEQLGGISHALIFSRIDYAIDLIDKEEALKLLLSFEKARKTKIYTEDKTITYKKTVKKLKKEIKNIFKTQNVKHIGIGSPETRLTVFYIKSDADPHLRSIYKYVGFPYGEKINGTTLYPYRIEVRFNAKHFKENRKIHFLENLEPWDLDTLIDLAFEEIKPYLTRRFKKYLTTPHPLITGPTQTIPEKVKRRSLKKLVKKQELKEKTLRMLTVFLTALKEDIEPTDMIKYAISLTQREDFKVMEKLKRHDISKKVLLKALRNICPTIEI